MVEQWYVVQHLFQMYNPDFTGVYSPTTGFWLLIKTCFNAVSIQ